MFRMFLILSLAIGVWGETLYEDPALPGLGRKSLSKSYCQNLPKNRRLCQKYTLSYPVAEKTTLPFAGEMPRRIAPYLEAYHKNSPRQTLQEAIEPGDTWITGKWFETLNMSLYAQTPSTYILRLESSGYSGGAHGYFNTAFENYVPGRKEPLKLSDLFRGDFNTTLHRIAEAHYRRIYGLAPNTPLTENGWFDGRFVLAQEFALTPEGVLFIYNQYEIKPYAAGQTRLLLPYSLLRPIIDPDGPLAFALHPSQALTLYFDEPNKLRISFSARPLADGGWALTLHARRFETSDAPGWLSLSFLDRKSAAGLSTAGSRGFDTLAAYPAGSRIYNATRRLRLPAHTLLVEGFARTWREDKPKVLHLTLPPAGSSGPMRLLLRLNFREKGRIVNYPHEYEGVTGQQGYSNWLIQLHR